MDRVRRLSQEILQKYPGMFGTDYTANKAQLAKIATVHSKMIRNKLVGKITKAMIAQSAEKDEAAGESTDASGTSPEGEAESA
jgi:ribosomal protein S17E